jgi:hypothetical protein
MLRSAARAADGWNQLINRKTRAEKTRDRDERMIGYLNKAFGNKPIDEVKPRDLIDLFETFEENGSYETRMRLQSTALNIAGTGGVTALIAPGAVRTAQDQGPGCACDAAG